MIKAFEELSFRDLEILNIIQKQGPITKKDLKVMTELKLTTLNRIMKTLEDAKVVMGSGESESTGGRKAIEYDISKTGFYVLGIDISRTYVKVVLTNMKLTILKQEKFTMDESYSPAKAVEKITFIIEKILFDLSINKHEVLGLGIGSVGPIDKEKGIILNPKSFFNSEWSNVPIKSMLEESLGLLCVIDNGANTAVLAEYLYGEGKDLKSIVYIHCGIGIRSAIISSGIIISTMNHKKDAFAHMIVEHNGEACSCGNKGCIESYSSLDSMVKKSSDTKIEGISKEIVKRGAEVLGVGLSNLVRLLDPELVILSGPLIINFENYYEKAIETFNGIGLSDNGVVFSKGGRFQEEVIALGAAAMVIEVYLKSI